MTGVRVRTARNRGSADAGSVVVGWLGRITIVFALLGVLGYDSIMVATTRADARSDAQAAADAAQASVITRPQVIIDYPDALLNARSALVGKAETLSRSDFHLYADGSVRLTLRRTVDTLLFAHLPWTKSWTVIVVSATASPPGTG